MRTTEITRDLSLQQRELVRYYTDPLLPTFSNKTASAAAAGYQTTKVFEHRLVQQEIDRILVERRSAGDEALEYLATYAADAARALVENLSLGKTLAVEDPQPLLGPPTEEEWETAKEMHREQERSERGRPKYPTPQDALDALVGARLERAQAITKANRVAVRAASEAREAAETILGHFLGDPSNRRHRGDDVPMDLANLSPDELLELGDLVASMLDKKRATVSEEDGGPVVEGKWEEEDPTEPA